jgi:hypothetical protein
VQADCTHLPLPSASIDVTLVDLPFGKRHKSKLGIRQLYTLTLAEVCQKCPTLPVKEPYIALKRDVLKLLLCSDMPRDARGGRSGGVNDKENRAEPRDRRRRAVAASGAARGVLGRPLDLRNRGSARVISCPAPRQCYPVVAAPRPPPQPSRSSLGAGYACARETQGGGGGGGGGGEGLLTRRVSGTATPCRGV